jgi:membrane protein DedA with SNARE-associated domain
MRAFLIAIFGSLISWWGVGLIAALDSTIIAVIPFAVDIAVIILASRSRELFWLYPIKATVGSIVGAALTFYIGRRLGEAGLEHFVAKGKLDRIRKRIEEKGAFALAVTDLIPPPFPFTACILVAGALELSTTVFFVTLAATRLLRFGVEAVLAHFYGRQIIGWLQSPIVEYIGIAFIVFVVLASIIAIIQLVRKTRAHRRPSRRHRAA